MKNCEDKIDSSKIESSEKVKESSGKESENFESRLGDITKVSTDPLVQNKPIDQNSLFALSSGIDILPEDKLKLQPVNPEELPSLTLEKAEKGKKKKEAAKPVKENQLDQYLNLESGAPKGETPASENSKPLEN